MRTSQYLLSTLKETPADAEVISHQLMLRAGMIRKLASGLYTWLPTGVRVLKKVENIVREEMNNAGAIEVSMPVVQPADLWQESGRWEQYGPELLRFVDRGERPFVLGPTHEEVITDLIRNELSSYKQLPLNFYQIQTKFRDEVRPRFGVMRSREFLMKDAYSFHTSQESLQETYDAMYAAYSKIFSRMGLDFRAVQADTGSIGGSASHEFQVLAQSGEDDVVFSDTSDYAANIELAEAIAPKEPRAAATQEMTLVDTPNAKTIAELVEQFNLPIEKTVKTLLVKAVEGSSFPQVALLVRGDHELNEVKAEKLPQVASPLTFATEEEIRAVVKAGPGSLGPVNMPIPVVIDRTVAAMSDFAAGANIDGKHYFGINWDRDVATPEVADIRNVTGAGVQIVSLKKAMKHSDKLFVLRVPDLTPQQATDITAFANKIKDSGYNYRGIVEFIPFMVTRQMCSLNPFSEDFRQQCVSGLAKAQLSSVGEGDKKSWFCSEFVTDAFAKAGHPLTLAQSGWISPADLMHMRIGDVSAFKPETQLQYVGHLKPGIYIKAGRFVGLTR